MNQAILPSSNLAAAASYAIAAHQTQVRKGTSIPYVSHLFAVAAIVMENGGDEELACAALLHDVIEDCGAEHELKSWLALALASPALSAPVPILTSSRSRPGALASRLSWITWRPHHDTLTVSCADKLHNARAIVADLRLHGPGMLSRFNAPPGGTEWYYAALAQAFERHFPGPMTSELNSAVRELESLVKNRTEVGRMTGPVIWAGQPSLDP